MADQSEHLGKQIVLRDQWKRSSLRPIALVLAAIVLLLIIFVVLASYTPILNGCATLERTVSTQTPAPSPTVSPGAVSPTVITKEVKCQPESASLGVLGILLGLFAILIIVEVATLLPGLKFSGAGLAGQTPPAVVAAEGAYDGSVDEVAAYEKSLQVESADDAPNA